MSAAGNPADDQITVEIDASHLRRAKSDDHRVTDAHGIHVRDSVTTANCRSRQLPHVSGTVEKAPSLAGCATPIADGMKIQTQSEYARKAQKA